MYIVYIEYGFHIIRYYYKDNSALLNEIIIVHYNDLAFYGLYLIKNLFYVDSGQTILTASF